MLWQAGDRSFARNYQSDGVIEGNGRRENDARHEELPQISICVRLVVATNCSLNERWRERVMTSVKLGVGMVMVGLMLATGAPTAQQVARDPCVNCQVTFQFGSGPEGSWLIASIGDGATLSKRVSRSGLSINLSAVGDSIDVTTASTGTVTLARKGVVIVVEPGDVLADHAEGVSRLLGESAAIEGLERMVQADAEQQAGGSHVGVGHVRTTAVAAGRHDGKHVAGASNGAAPCGEPGSRGAAFAQRK
jgi:hypothetical protein